MSSAAQVAASTPYPAGQVPQIAQAANDLLAYIYNTDPSQNYALLGAFATDMVVPSAAALAITNFRVWNGTLPKDAGPLDVTTRLAQLAVLTSPVWTTSQVVAYFQAMASQLDSPDPGLSAALTQLASPPPSGIVHVIPTPPPSHNPPPNPNPGGVIFQVGPPLPVPTTGGTTTVTTTNTPAPMATGTKVAIGAGVVAGTGFLALLWYSLSHGLTLVQGISTLVEGGKAVKKAVGRERGRKYRRSR